MLPLNLYARVRTFLCTLHTRPRVQRAPGLPCALCFQEVQNEMQTSGEICRGNAKPYPAVIASASEAIHLAAQRKNGLLRFARNDG